VPAHVLLEHANAHVETPCHTPAGLHVSTLRPLQRTLPGTHPPPHVLPVQMKPQSLPLSHVPSDLQLYWWLFSHLIAVPGWQAPTHAPPVQKFGHDASTCQSPAALHVRSVAPSQDF
jgi:hypothetical protein